MWRTLARHQLGALAATALDFATMIFVVKELGLPPTTGTALGAMLGAVVNFLLGRTWIFRVGNGHWAGQAARYALTSGTSAGLNTLGEYLLYDRAHLNFVAARLVVACAVSLLWNFPAQRRFVFREGPVQ